MHVTFKERVKKTNVPPSPQKLTEIDHQIKFHLSIQTYQSNDVTDNRKLVE